MQKNIIDFEHPTCKGKSIQCWIIYLKLLPLQGVTNERALTQGVASLALGYVLLPFQGVHYRLRLSNSNKFDCVRFAR